MGGIVTPPPLPVDRPAVGQPVGVNQPSTPIPPPPGALPYRMPVSAQIASGLDTFMKNFYNTRQTMRAGASQQFNDLMQQIHLGTTNPRDLDFKKIMKLGREAGLPLRTEAPTPEEQQYEQAQQSAQMQTANSRIAGQMYDPGSPMQQMMAQGGTPPSVGPPPTPAPPTFMQRLKAGIGIRPPVSLQSPYGQDLQAMAQAAWQGGAGNPAQIKQQRDISQLQSNIEQFHQLPFEQMSYDSKMDLMKLGQKALNNDPMAIQQLTRWGILKGVPGDDLAPAIHNMDPSLSNEEVWSKAGELQMWGQIGLPLLQHKLALAKDLLPRFAGVATMGGDPMAAAQQYVEDIFSGRTPTTRPSLTDQELKDMSDAASPMIKQHPLVAGPIIEMYKAAQLAGNKPLVSQLAQLIGQSPTAGSLEEQRITRQFGLDQYKTYNEVQNAKDQISLNTIEQITKMGGAEIAGYLDTIHDKTTSPQDKEAAKQGIALATQKLGQVKIPIPGQYDKDGKPVMFSMDPQAVMSALNWWEKKWLNVPPYLAPMGYGGQIPGQVGPKSPFDGDESEGFLGAIEKSIGRMVETPGQRKERLKEYN